MPAQKRSFETTPPPSPPPPPPPEEENADDSHQNQHPEQADNGDGTCLHAYTWICLHTRVVLVAKFYRQIRVSFSISSEFFSSDFQIRMTVLRLVKEKKTSTISLYLSFPLAFFLHTHMNTGIHVIILSKLLWSCFYYCGFWHCSMFRGMSL